MKKVIIFSIAIFAAAFTQNSFAASNANQAGTPEIIKPLKTVTLNASTSVYLELAEQLNPQKMTTGRIMKFTVKMNVFAEGRLVIRTGAIAVGRIKSIEQASYNDPMEVNIEISTVQAVDNTMVDLNGTEALFLSDEKIPSLPQLIARVMNDTEIDAK
jgi:hypothetical protein